MLINSKQQTNISQMTRLILVLSLVGLVIASSGIIWLASGYNQLEQRAALYNGCWTLKAGPLVLATGFLTNLKISNKGLILTIKIQGHDGSDSTNATFSAEPVSFTALGYNFTMSLNNASNTQLKVLLIADSVYTFIFVKNGP